MQVTQLLKNQGHVLSIERVNLFLPGEAVNQPSIIDIAGSSDHYNRMMTLAPDPDAITTTAEAARRKREDHGADNQAPLDFSGASGQVLAAEHDQMDGLPDNTPFVVPADLQIGSRTEDETASPALASMSHGDAAVMLS